MKRPVMWCWIAMLGAWLVATPALGQPAAEPPPVPAAGTPGATPTFELREAPERELLETSTAQAVFFSALTTMASFGSLSFARHAGFASLGQLLLLGVGYTLLVNLIVLPALLARRSDERSNAGAG